MFTKTNLLKSLSSWTVLKVYFFLFNCLHLISQVNCFENPFLFHPPLPPPPFLPSNMPNNYRSGASSRLDSSAELVLGTFSQVQEHSWFYETYYPVLLKVPIPNWSAGNIRLNESAPRCDNDKMEPDYLCPAQYHLENMLVRLSQNTRFFRNIYMANAVDLFRDKGEEDEIYEKNSIHCLRIRPHFFHFATTLKGLEPYLNELRKKYSLAKDIGLIEKDLSSSASLQNASRAAYEQFTKYHRRDLSKRKFLNLIKSYHKGHSDPNTQTEHEHEHEHEHESNSSSSGIPIPSDSSSSSSKSHWEGESYEDYKFIQIAGMTALQNALTLSTYVDSVRWANAFSTCQGSRLDISLISAEVLTSVLQEVSQNLTRLGLPYNISIPFDTLLTHYYKLPLTDCVLAIEGPSDAHLVLRLLIPVTPLFRHYKLVKLNKVPFFLRASKNSSSSGDLGSICEIKNYRYDEMFIVEYDTSGGMSYEPVIRSIMKAPLTCYPYHVCRIPDQVHRSLVDPCVEGILTKNEDVAKDKCDFKCYSVTKKQAETEFPYVIQLTSNRFAVVGATLNETKGENVTIKCFGKMRVTAVKQDTMDEATIITLPCPCEIVYGDRSYTPQRPCNGTLEIIHVTHVLPDDAKEGFRTLGSGSSSGGNGRPNLEDLQRERIANHTSANKTGGGGGGRKNRSETGKDSEETGSDEFEYLEDYDLFHTPFTSTSQEKHADRLWVVDASGGSGWSWSHVFIWILGLMLLASNVFMLYTLYKNGFFTLDSVLLTNT